MAIKILKEGRIPDKEYTTGCNRCMTIFSFNASDARFIHDARAGNYYEIACPKCAYRCTVKEDYE